MSTIPQRQMDECRSADDADRWPMIRRDCTTHPTSDNSLVRVSGWWPRLDWSILSVLEWCAMS